MPLQIEVLLPPITIHVQKHNLYKWNRNKIMKLLRRTMIMKWKVWTRHAGTIPPDYAIFFPSFFLFVFPPESSSHLLRSHRVTVSPCPTTAAPGQLSFCWLNGLIWTPQAMVETVNNLLQPQAQAAWRELSTGEQLRAATMLLDTVEQGAFVLADNLLKTDIVQENTDNIRECERRRCSRQASREKILYYHLRHKRMLCVESFSIHFVTNT